MMGPYPEDDAQDSNSISRGDMAASLLLPIRMQKDCGSAATFLMGGIGCCSWVMLLINDAANDNFEEKVRDITMYDDKRCCMVGM
jgi:hypothetical protein